MPRVLTTNALIQCPHSTVGQSQSFDPSWSINGGMVLVEDDRGLFLPPGSCPSQVQCVGYTLKSMGLNATQIKGKKVILATDFNQTDSGLPLTILETTHKVEDDTSLAPIPDGQDAPPLPPPLADETKPSVIVAPVGPLEFTLATGTPLTLGATFTLTSAHPLKWILTLIHDVPGGSVDRLNESRPAGLTLNTSDGVWDGSPLQVILSMTAAYMLTLVAGAHRFFMTGVSQRGISNFVELVLTVKP